MQIIQRLISRIHVYDDAPYQARNLCNIGLFVGLEN